MRLAATLVPWTGRREVPINQAIVEQNKLRTVPSTRREELLAAIAEEEARLAKLEADQALARSRLAGLRAEFDEYGVEPQVHVRLPLVVNRPAPKTPVEKVNLFRSLFRGREDVFPTRFVSKKTEKSGYAPACRNKFVRGICALPRVKCGECPNQAFVQVDDAAVVGHLTPSRDGCVPAPGGRDLLVPGGRLRREHLG